MKPVVLVSLDWRRPQDGRTGLGIASIAAALQAAGVPLKIVDAQVNSTSFSLEQVQRQLEEAICEVGQPCLVGFGVYVWNDDEVLQLINHIKRPGVGVVLGGPQISYMKCGALEAAYPQADVFVRGQGEMAMVALATGGPTVNCGIHMADTPDLGGKADHDLLVLPSPWLSGTAPLQRNIRWETQRGCPFKCSFCQHREPGVRLINQTFHQDRLDRELALFAAHGVERISVLDPIFHANPQRAIDILEQAKTAGLTAHLALQCRFEMCTSAFLDTLDGLSVTLEFGLQTTIEAEYRAIGRPNRMDVVERTIRDLQARSLDFEVSLIYGLPNQTYDSFQQSVDWCLQQRIPRVRAWPLMLLRGTPLYEERERHGFVERGDQHIPIVIASNSFTEADHARMEHIARMLERRS
ncbi:MULTISPECIES: B12-binding domain-containing radical SAM protein [Pseudomonas]|jgi:radical SAM superfamily enzyme YgiQ (UPF0313 family)|uniref:B12-binding domain-containing radical SAM protein n=1 Tax=Pseudomonas TaxID=286 RepID=UPI000F829EE7|nr:MULTISPECIES: B12-binding domain-containing radical SAM protein [Pseudomonas]MBK3445978.1 cobalamin-dependent protein [Pseudomonas lactis]RTY71077.1 radical SAM protein [Pseudomonas veronii]